MKINIKQLNDEILEVDTYLMSIDEVEKNGNKIIVLHTKDGNFSNFKALFEKQKLDVDSLNENDIIHIKYKLFEARNGVKFKNFLTISKFS